MSTDTTLASDTAHRLKTELRIFDCDVHPVPQAGLVSLTPYLPAAWRERFARKQAVHDGLNVPIRFKHPNGSVVRQDARTPEGLPPASSPQHLVADLIEKHEISGALLNCFEAGGLLSVQASTEESIVLAAAYNDLFIEEWLSVDKRLKYAAAVPTQDPVAAAAEIRRVGKHPQVCAIFIPLVDLMMGHRYYWPIYEACQLRHCPAAASKASHRPRPPWSAGTFDYLSYTAPPDRHPTRAERWTLGLSSPVRLPLAPVA